MQIRFGQVFKTTFAQPMGGWNHADAYAKVSQKHEALSQIHKGPDDVVLLKDEESLLAERKLPWAVYVLTDADGARYKALQAEQAKLFTTATEQTA